jgi:thioredoxin-related protein
MKKLLCLLLIHPLLINAQIMQTRNEQHPDEKGITWSEGLTWEQVKAKAKAENKYIFVDYFATWCAPCKYMDKEVYSKDNVGDYFNNKFISLKVQKDTTNADSDNTKLLYAVARELETNYKINALPTHFFFSPNGKIVHRGKGARNDTDFLGLAANSLNPKKQYYTLLEDYQQGRKNYEAMAYLATKALSIDDKEIANIISQDYINNYIFNLKKEELFTWENLNFLNTFTQSSKDKGFKLFYQHAAKIDTIMNFKNYSRNKIDFIITNEEIDPRLDQINQSETRTPDWHKITSTINRKYTEGYADRVVINAKLNWYKTTKDWPQLIKCFIQKKEIYGLSVDVESLDEVNSFAYEIIFMHSDDREVINKAIKWMKIVVEKTTPSDGIIISTYMDTYANLLYKNGKINEAIEWETKALQIAKNKSAEAYVQVYQYYLDLMKKGDPTW